MMKAAARPAGTKPSPSPEADTLEASNTWNLNGPPTKYEDIIYK